MVQAISQALSPSDLHTCTTKQLAKLAFELSWAGLVNPTSPLLEKMVQLARARVGEEASPRLLAETALQFANSGVDDQGLFQVRCTIICEMIYTHVNICDSLVHFSLGASHCSLTFIITWVFRSVSMILSNMLRAGMLGYTCLHKSLEMRHHAELTHQGLKIKQAPCLFHMDVDRSASYPNGDDDISSPWIIRCIRWYLLHRF